jgi:exonuclease I
MTKRSSNDGDDSSDRANISDDGESSLSSNDNITSSNNKRSLYNFKFYNNNQNKTTRRTDESQHTTLPELSWRITKVRLEEANTRRILRRKPLKLPYAQSSKWIQFNYAPQTKEEFEQLVMDGTLKNVYISKRPEEYYSERGEWISWDHYLLGKCSSSNGGGDGTIVNNATEILKWQ